MLMMWRMVLNGAGDGGAARRGNAARARARTRFYQKIKNKIFHFFTKQ